MLLSENWLREYVNPAVSTESLVKQLTMAGLEVDAFNPAAGLFSGVYVGQIVSLEKHPDADKLSVCQVKINSTDVPLQIVCGAANAKAGLKVPVATIGAVLPGDFKIKKTKLRGIESNGMLCAAQELGLAESSAGLLELNDSAPLGQDLRFCLSLEDFIIEVDLTPNRGDCLSIRGLAREVGVLNNMNSQTIKVNPTVAVITDLLKVKLSAPEACPRYAGRILKNINAQAETPLWMIERLRRGGIRSIDAVVDVTNYVLLELGQPMHAFDLDSLHGDIEVRFAKPKEKLTLLNGQEVELRNDSLVIADAQKTLALAGIMGGKQSSVNQQTKNLFLESAFFSPLALAGKARSYGLHTDSSHRFERGVDFQLQVDALERATELLMEIVGGEAGPVTESISKNDLPVEKQITLRKERVSQLLGFKLDNVEIENILKRLGMLLSANQKGWQVKVPSWRFDINLEIDLIEEIGRIYGYNRLPVAALNFSQRLLPDSEGVLDKTLVLHLLVNSGYQESVCYSFVDQTSQQVLDPDAELLILANPISSELAVMRTTLWAGLIKAAVFNQNRQQNALRLFEHGLVFHKQANNLEQKKMLAGIVSKQAQSAHWDHSGKQVDFYDVKADLENLFALSGCSRDYRFEACTHHALHPGQAAAIYRKQDLIGYLGALHPDVAKKLGLELELFVFELDLDAVLQKELPVYKPVSKFPGTSRDLALILDKGVSAQAILDVINQNGSDILQNVSIFDVFEGQNIDKGKKSIALSLTLQHSSRTLEDLEVTDLVDKIVITLKQNLDAKLRD